MTFIDFLSFRRRWIFWSFSLASWNVESQRELHGSKRHGHQQLSTDADLYFLPANPKGGKRWKKFRVQDCPLSNLEDVDQNLKDDHQSAKHHAKGSKQAKREGKENLLESTANTFHSFPRKLPSPIASASIGIAMRASAGHSVEHHPQLAMTPPRHASKSARSLVTSNDKKRLSCCTWHTVYHFYQFFLFQVPPGFQTDLLVANLPPVFLRCTS